MKKLKEKTIPITKFDFACYGLMFLVALSIIGLVYFTSEGNVSAEGLGLSLLGLILGGLFGFIFCSEKWDLNPIHAIGYCLRFKVGSDD